MRRSAITLRQTVAMGAPPARAKPSVGEDESVEEDDDGALAAGVLVLDGFRGQSDVRYGRT
ncbi:hypothetical protein GCM10010308_15040 [Streptomyces vinaceusdrappus]|nr:hypothetical protein GCM10010308_15040 [Streptomyces vinaceusdrappus]